MRSDVPPAPSPPADAEAQRERLAATLAGLRAGVRQRQGEAATVRSGADELHGLLIELHRNEFVQEPVPVSPRPGIGRFIVFVRKVFYHLFVKWHARAALQQQNGFNQSASQLLAELAERSKRSDEEIARLRERLSALEALQAAASPPDGESGR